MDYFYVGNGHKNLGLVDIFFKTKFKLGKKAVLLAHYHHFNAAANLPPEQNLSTNLGDELDLVLAVNMAPGAKFHLGYSQMLGTSSMAYAKGGDPSQFTNWAWAMLTIKPTLFSAKK